MYAPLESVGINRYGAGSTAGGFVFTSPPDRILRSVAPVKFAPLTSAPLMSDPVRFAPLKSE